MLIFARTDWSLIHLCTVCINTCYSSTSFGSRSFAKRSLIGLMAYDAYPRAKELLAQTQLTDMPCHNALLMLSELVKRSSSTV